MKTRFFAMLLVLACVLNLAACEKGHKHSFGSWQVIEEALCDADGTKERVCKCGEKQTEVIAATGHNYVDGKCSVCGERTPSEGLEFELTEGGYLLTGRGSCTDTEIVIPATYEGLPVVAVAGYAFGDTYGKEPSDLLMTSVSIPNSVKTIGFSAFALCENLAQIKLSERLSYVDSNVFDSTAYLKDESNWTDGVLYIGNCLIEAKETLSGNHSIREGTRCIAAEAFKSCHDLEQITIPNGVKTIGAYAFAGCSRLQSVTIPESVELIDDMAFGVCIALADITLPDTDMTIGRDVFSRTAYELDESNWTEDVLYLGNALLEVRSSISGTCTVKEGTRQIASWAFYYCSDLSGIVIPDSVTSIDDEAFGQCSALTSISVAEGNSSYRSAGNCLIETASKKLILGCQTSVIPADGSVTCIGDRAFATRSGLTSITIPNSVTSIGYMAFSNCTGLTSITIPNGVTSIGESAFSGCTGLTSIVIPDSVTSIGEGAFSNCIGLTSITIPDSVTSIGYMAFSNCTGLTSATIGNGVTSIIDYAFRGCTGLTSITIPDGVTSIGSYAFADCIRLTSITIPDSVTSIGSDAFSDCIRLTSITIPDSVTSIGWNAFYKCSSLTSITFEGTTQQWNAINNGSSWNYGIENITIQCTDGDISKGD